MKLCYRWAAVVLALAVVLQTGCSRGMNISGDTKEGKAYALPEIMIVAMTEKNRYEDVYTEQIWQVSIGEEGITFNEYLKGQVEIFMDELKTMNLLAKDKGIVLTGAEQEQIRELSKEYYSELTREDIEYMKVTEEDVAYLYGEYHTANKLVNELTKGVDLEVSDNEAKVISIQQITMDNRETADRVSQEVTVDGADFEAIAKANSVGTDIKRQLGRGEESSVFEEEAFSLETGQISPVIEAGNRFYILKAVNAYDEEATQERKKQLSAQKKNQAFRQLYDQFITENPVSFDRSVWNSISFSESDETSTSNFFELYREYFPN